MTTAGMYEIISKKRDGLELDRDEIAFVVSGCAKGEIPDYQVAAWLMAVYLRGLNERETADLTELMLDSGDRIRLDSVTGPKIDKHSTGGVGDKISFVVAPLLAACGVKVPMLSGRGLGHTGGTLDKLEAIPGMNVFLTPERFRGVLAETGMVICGQTANIVPADKKLYALRDATATVPSIPLIVASILSKKLAAGATHLLLDIPFGPTAKVRQMRAAQSLRRLFEYVGDALGIHLEAVITDGRQPIGRGIGPALEARDVMQVLRNDPAAPMDLRQKALRLAGRVLEFDPDVRGGSGFAIARDILDSGRALARMQALIDAQGRNREPPHPAPLTFEAKSPARGVVTGIDNLRLAHVARLAGAPMTKGAGVDLLRKLGDPVAKGAPLYRVHAGFPAELHFARALSDRRSGFTIGRAGDVPGAYAEF